MRCGTDGCCNLTHFSSSYRPSLNYFVSIRRRLSPTGDTAEALSPLSLTQGHSNSSAAPEEEFNPIVTAADWSGGCNSCGDSVSCLLLTKQVTIPGSTAAEHRSRSQKMQVQNVDQSQCLWPASLRCVVTFSGRCTSGYSIGCYIGHATTLGLRHGYGVDWTQKQNTKSLCKPYLKKLFSHTSAPHSTGEERSERESFVLQKTLTVQHLASSFWKRD